jgi:hypothetical protein
MTSPLVELADAYLRNHIPRDQDFWAWQEVHRLVKTDLIQGWSITQMLIQMADSDAALGYVAAGPLEDLVDIYGDARRSISSKMHVTRIHECN